MLLAWLHISAQKQLIFDQLTTDNGLSDNKVNDLVQDEHGFMWIATENGLNRYDGSQFKKFFRGSKPTELPGNVITKLMRMRGNYIAVGTDRGAVVLNTRTNDCRRITIPSLPGTELFANHIIYLSSDSENELIVSSRTGVFVFSDHLKLVAKIEAGFTIEDTKTKPIGFAGMSLLLNKDTVIIYTDHGFVLYNMRSKKLDYLQHSPDPFYRYTAKLLDSVNTYSLALADKNVLFFVPNYSSVSDVFTIDFSLHTVHRAASKINFKSELGWQSFVSRINDSTYFCNAVDKGYFVFHYSPEKKIVSVENKKFLPQYSFHLFYRDKNNRLWSGGKNGIQKQSFSRELFNNTPLEEIIKLDGTLPAVKGFYSNKKNLLYVALENEQTGLIILDSQHRLLEKVNLNAYSKFGNSVWSLFRWYGDTIAISTQTGLLFYNTSIGKISKPGDNFPAAVNSVPIPDIFRDRQDNTWLGLGYGNGVLLYNHATGLAKQFFPGTADTSFRLRYPNSIAEDTAGNIWFMHKGQGITRWNFHSQQFDTLITGFNKEGIGYFDFVSLDADKQGNLWIGFLDYGLMKLNTATGETKMYTVKSGLAANSIINVFAKVPGQVWMIYPYGIGVLTTETGNIKNFSRANGLPDYTVSSLNFYYKPLLKQLMIGFENAFTSFDPFVVASTKEELKVYLTEIENRYDSLTLNPDADIALKYFQNDISINFSAIDYNYGSNINYEYRLYKNEKTPWINILHQQTVNLVNLSPGNYIFQVRAVGDISSTATKKIGISSPFYQTLWFYTMCGILVFAALYSLYRYRINQLLQLQKVRNRISADLHDDIGARLTNINLLSALGEQKLYEPQLASDYLKRISNEVQTSGEALDDIVWSINTKNDSVEEITARMRRYAADVFDGTSIHYSILADENILSAKLSMEKRRDIFLVYKETINNVFKHAMATEVHITIKVKNKWLLMQISDNGKGFDPQRPTQRNGLKNIQYRMEKSGGNFTVQSIIGKGTTFIIKLPFSSASLKRSILSWFITNSFA
jgi:signal transduction histidine kinase/ligand-binding sensor domain-containing protein